MLQQRLEEMRRERDAKLQQLSKLHAEMRFWKGVKDFGFTLLCCSLSFLVFLFFSYLFSKAPSVE
jgi:hypothetical protein